MKTCETCKWTKDENNDSTAYCSNKKSPVRGVIVLKDCLCEISCIHHEEPQLGPPEVTVEEAIERLKLWDLGEFNLLVKKVYKLAIRALEEMREREKNKQTGTVTFQPIAGQWFSVSAPGGIKPKPLTNQDFNTSDLNQPLREILDGFPCKGDGTEYQMIYKGKDYYINIHVGRGPIRILKRTWREVTAGELVAELNKKGWDGDACDIKQTAEYLAERKPSRDRTDK